MHWWTNLQTTLRTRWLKNNSFSHVPKFFLSKTHFSPIEPSHFLRQSILATILANPVRISLQSFSMNKILLWHEGANYMWVAMTLVSPIDQKQKNNMTKRGKIILFSKKSVLPPAQFGRFSLAVASFQVETNALSLAEAGWWSGHVMFSEFRYARNEFDT